MLSDSDESISGTPPELKEAAAKVEASLLPTKSKERYEKSLQTYSAWCITKKTKNIGSETILLAYFGEMAKLKKPSTLWATYSMLRTMIQFKEKIDISRHGKLIAFLKRQNVGYKPKKSSIFSRENIEEYLSKAPEEFLTIKVALIIGVSGACRSDELMKMKTTHVCCLQHKVSIEIPDTKTYRSRSFFIVDPSWVNMVQKYINMRKSIQNERFFLQWRYGKLHNQVVGYHSILSFPKKIASFLKLSRPDTFTGHAFRRTAATLLADNGADILQLKRLGGWKSSQVAEGYVESSIQNQYKAAEMISCSEMPSCNQPGRSIEVPVPEGQIPNQTMLQDGLKMSINIYNSPNCVINFNK